MSNSTTPMKNPIFRLFRSLCVMLALSALSIGPCLAGEETSGTPFFLLSDASYGSADTAIVRLEAQDMGAIGEYGGVDVYVYRVKQPLEFLKAQKNMHRIDVEGKYIGSGISNALARTWDQWWRESRTEWRKLFSADVRQAVTAQAPGVRTHPLSKAATPTTLNPMYRQLKAHTLVDSFRYPVHVAKPIEPPAGVKLAGSSSDFIAVQQGNVLIPLGKREPGLYLVEAMAGAHRAVTLVFVSDAIAVTKVSGQQMLVWVADRRDSKPVAGAKTVWSDGVGVLASANTDAHGVAMFKREAPEKTYVYGEDPKGGVYVAENFYYDSEIYNTKMYAVTDRPLYRPGEMVFVKFLGRTFRSARESVPIGAGELKLQVFDANGFPVASQSVQMSPQTGGDTRFQLPDNAVAGGYELRFAFEGNSYGAAFRVAEYQKPHFEINVLPAKKDYKTNEELKGKLQLTYPDGKPVINAKAELTVRAQRLSMIEGDLGYAGQFPVQLKTAMLTTGIDGTADFALPAATEPSRYVLSVLATDGAAYRVRATKEILIERGAGTYAVKAERAFSGVKENVNFSVRLLQNGAVVANPSAPATWEWIRLENRKKDSGKLTSASKLTLAFAEPGTYTLSLRDAEGNIVGATSHFVSGAGVAAPQGSIEMVFDKTQYKPGDTASALITFPQAVEQALLTLERDQVEKTALLTGGNSGAAWIKTKRLSPLQWRVEMSVQDDYGPNITLSVVYVKGGEYVFQNLGLKVAQPRIDVAVQANKAVYAPGDKVTLNLSAMVGGKAAVGSQLTVGVVDELVYVLQPEIAPDVFDFFYHPRRNNVRTSASLAFITYDLAKPPSRISLPSHRQTQQRAIKVLERPRREDKDTAFWQPSVSVDANGRATVSFIMPDSLTRWRITVRAAAPSGTVGQSVAHVRSDKDFYLKWTSPNWMRSSDAPNASVAIFNQGASEATLDFNATGPGLKHAASVQLKPGANFVTLPLMAAGQNAVPHGTAPGMQLDLALAHNGKTVDALTVPIKLVPLAWRSKRSQTIPLAGQETAFTLPPDASNISLQLTDGAGAQMRRLMDDLIDYPYGCVEQTSSRLIPYSLALQSVLPSEERLAAQLSQRLHSYRFRLAQLAGPQATFGWWSVPNEEKEADPFMTAYAYYADWHASRALKLALPLGHFDRLLEVYGKTARGTGYYNDGKDAKSGSAASNAALWRRALMLYWMQEMGLPVRTLAEALADDAAKDAAESVAESTAKTDAAGKAAAAAAAVAPAAAPAAARNSLGSVVLAQNGDEGDLQRAMSTLLAAYVVQQTKGKLAPVVKAQLAPDSERVRQAGLPLADALLLLTGKLPAADAAGILERVRAETPTIDRALSLLWTYRALGGNSGNAHLLQTVAKAALDPAWQQQESATGQKLYRWANPKALPSTIKLTAALPAGSGLNAVAQFDSSEAEKTSLPVKLQRRFYRLVKERSITAAVLNPKKGKNGGSQAAGSAAAAPAAAAADSAPGSFTLELLAADAVLKTDEVYLDELVLTSEGPAPLRFGIVEAPLPPGTTADRTTWGINIKYQGISAVEALEAARYEQTPRGYAVPIDQLQGTQTIRHLVRAAQSGKFMMPPARYYRMYQPEQKAFEENARAAIEIR
jgi:uncharacterized protein YfaS (alpha-2-macroglobulin family)